MYTAKGDEPRSYVFYERAPTAARLRRRELALELEGADLDAASSRCHFQPVDCARRRQRCTPSRRSRAGGTRSRGLPAAPAEFTPVGRGEWAHR